jgi:hypothetical protein
MLGLIWKRWVLNQIYNGVTADGESCKMLEAPYVLDKKKYKVFYDCISQLKFPDGYTSNF